MNAAHIVAALVAVALVAYVVWRRERVVISLLAAAALGVYASGVLGGLPNAEKLIEDIANALGSGTYALVGVMAFLETGAFVGLIAPGEFTVIVGGVIAGQGTIEILPLIGLTWFCCILGDSTSFFIGRRLGREFLMRHGPRVKITHERLEQVEDYFARHGGKTILIGRFIGLVRAVAPFIAGSSGMRYGRFLPYSVIGTGLWATLYLLLGFFFYRSFHRVAAIAGRATLVFGLLVAIVVGAIWSYRQLRDDEKRARFVAWLERQSRRPFARPLAALLRPVWRVAWPQIRFLWGRITPGDLGLELTTALAVAGVGAYVFVAFLVTVEGNLGPTPVDSRLLDVAHDLRTGILVSVAKVVTAFGSLPVAGLVALAGAVVLASRRRPIELAVLVISVLAIVAVVHITKGAVDRPRPPHRLTGTSGAAFPSGHSAYSTIYVAMAVIAARVLPGVVSRASVVLGAVILAVAIGASRIYLQVHWASDVAGGWGVGAAIFGIVGAIALIVGYFGNNGGSRRPDEPPPAHEPVSTVGN